MRHCSSLTDLSSIVSVDVTSEIMVGEKGHNTVSVYSTELQLVREVELHNTNRAQRGILDMAVDDHGNLFVV